MTVNDFTASVAKMGVRKNNMLTVDGYKIEKWGNDDRFCLTAPDGKYIGVAGVKWLVGKLTALGVIK